MVCSPGNNHQISTKKIVFLIGCAFLFACCLMIATTPIHELGHLVMSSCDPHLKIVAFYPFGVPKTPQNSHILSSILGCVIVKEAYPGAFHDRPAWADFVQEIICLTIQMIITCFFTIKILGSLSGIRTTRQHIISSSTIK